MAAQGAEQMEKHTRKQIVEAIAYWQKQLNEASEDPMQATQLRLDSILKALDAFDQCGPILRDGTPLLPNAKLPLDAVQQLRSIASGKVNAIGICKVLSRDEYAAKAEFYHDIPYEEYIDDEKDNMQNAFERDSLSMMFMPSNILLVEDATVDYEKGCAVLAAVYSMS